MALGEKYLEWTLDNVQDHLNHRFGPFSLTSILKELDDDGWPDSALAIMEEAVKQGVKGLKVYKGLGLTDKDNDGNRIAIDDPRLDPILGQMWSIGDSNIDSFR